MMSGTKPCRRIANFPDTSYDLKLTTSHKIQNKFHTTDNLGFRFTLAYFRCLLGRI